MQRWTAEQAWQWYHSHPLSFGCNFLPSSAVNSTEMWQASTFDEPTIIRELSWAATVGMNSCRVFLQFLVWQENPQGMKERLNRFLTLASQFGISTVLVLFDDCAFAGKEPHLGPQNRPVPGLHNSGWTPSTGPTIGDDRAQWPHLRAYLHDILDSFAHDQRILLWDLYNEPGNSNRGTTSLPLLEAVFTWAKQVSISQPITSGVWGGDKTDKFCALHSDVITLHDYNDEATTRAWIEQVKAQKRPIICTEWMARTRKSRIETHLPLFLKEKIGCYLWGLVNGQTQTHYPWGSVPDAPEPDLWFHDLFHQDGTPYLPEEIALLKDYSRRFKIL